MCRKTHAFDTDYIMYVRPIEYHEATDDYGRIIPNKYIKVQYYDVKRRIDRHLATSANNLLVEITKGILKQNLKDENLINFIDNIDLRCFYLTNPEHKIAWGGIKIENFNKNFSDLDFLLFHETDKTGNYFGAYEKTTKRMCNRMEYYVNMKKLAQYVKKCKESTKHYQNNKAELTLYLYVDNCNIKIKKTGEDVTKFTNDYNLSYGYQYYSIFEGEIDGEAFKMRVMTKYENIDIKEKEQAQKLYESIKDDISWFIKESDFYKLYNVCKISKRAENLMQ